MCASFFLRSPLKISKLRNFSWQLYKGCPSTPIVQLHDHRSILLLKPSLTLTGRWAGAQKEGPARTPRHLFFLPDLLHLPWSQGPPPPPANPSCAKKAQANFTNVPIALEAKNNLRGCDMRPSKIAHICHL